MSPGIQREDLEAAIQDLRDRTLAGLRGEFARLIYLSSMRNYNTGQYYHEGLASQFSAEIAVTALALCHEQTFRSLVYSPLEAFVKELDSYVGSTGEHPEDVLEFWMKFEPYRVVIPMDCESLAAELFTSNVRVALAVLQARQETTPDSRQSA